PVTGVKQEEGAGSVRAFPFAGVEAALAKESRLLIAGDAADRNAVGEEIEAAGGSEIGGTRPHFGEQVARNLEISKQLVVPLHRVDIEEEGAAGVAGVGEVAAAGEPPDQEGIDGAAGEVAGRGADVEARIAGQKPVQLRAREVRIEGEAGAFGQPQLVGGAIA